MGAWQNLKDRVTAFDLFLHHLGLDWRRFRAIRHFGRYRAQLDTFRRLGGKVTRIFPILTDFADQAGSAKGHYFHQDLLVASFIHARGPIRHVDIGSRIDGFVAHVAAYRPIEVIDVRDLGDTGHPNISFIKADLMSAAVEHEVADSISCLHAIEHFGLGRYGEPIDPDGHKKGFKNIINMLKPNGVLYISFPIGPQNEVHFNANRVFHPRDVLNWSDEQALELELERFDFVDDSGALQRDAIDKLDSLGVSYGCGIYTFRRLARRAAQMTSSAD